MKKKSDVRNRGKKLVRLERILLYLNVFAAINRKNIKNITVRHMWVSLIIRVFKLAVIFDTKVVFSRATPVFT
jgi:hypothetical protein